MTAWTSRLLIAATVVLAACQGSTNVTCSLVGGTQLAPTTWPKFRADVANSGRADVDLTTNDGHGTLLFDGSCFSGTTQLVRTCTVGVDGSCPSGQTCVRIGPVSTSPILGPTQDIAPANVYLASSDGTVYVLNPPPTPPAPTPSPTPGAIQVNGAILGSPLLGADGTLFVASNAQLEQFLSDGTPKNVAPLIGFAAAAPNIWPVDGTVFVATQAGSLAAVCPNGVARFAVTVPGTQAMVLVVQDPNFVTPNPTPTITLQTPIIVVGGVNGQVRAFTLSGNQYWSFLASANIVAALMADMTTDILYVADTAGRVFAVQLTNGQAVTSFAFATDEFAPGERPGISASPALGNDAAAEPTLYVADVGHYPERGGVLYALNRASGAVRWKFPDVDRGDASLEGPIISSPAVATGGAHDVIVFAVDVLGTVDPAAPPVPIGGKVYAIQDDGGDRRAPLWPVPFDAHHSIGSSSPSIGIDGRVYIGRQGNRRGVSTECPQVGQACVISDGGGLYAIGPAPVATATPVPSETPLPTATPIPT